MSSKPLAHRFPRPWMVRLLLPGLFMLLAGCTARVGSRMIEKSFANYGETVQSVVQEELLTNLVRRRYHKPPQFVTLSGIRHTQSLSRRLDVSSRVSRPFSSSLAGGAFLNMDDIPSYSISPQQGPEFAQKLHMRIPLQALPQLTNAGYSAELVVALLVQEMAGIRGIDPRTGDSFRPGSSRFQTILQTMKALEDRNQLKIANVLWEEPQFEHAFGPENFSPDRIAEVTQPGMRYITLDGGETFYVTAETVLPALWVDSAAPSSTSRQLLGLLNLDPSVSREAWVLQAPKYVQGKKPDAPQRYLTIETRSFYALLNLLALGVRVPGQDEAGSAKQGTALPDIAHRFQVFHSRSRPHAAYLSVKTADGWFYIDAQDVSSQRIFNILNDLYQLQVAPPTGPRSPIPEPVLSIRGQ